jgi:hypothetical protein
MLTHAKFIVVLLVLLQIAVAHHHTNPKKCDCKKRMIISVIGNSQAINPPDKLVINFDIVYKSNYKIPAGVKVAGTDIIKQSLNKMAIRYFG